MAIAPGTRIGAYEVIAQIGAGGMGEVYRAHDTTLKREVAVEVRRAGGPVFLLDQSQLRRLPGMDSGF